MLKKILMLAIALAFGIKGGIAQDVLTLDKALDIAFQNSPTLIQSKLNLEQRQLNLKAQNASLKSQFSLDINPFSYSRNNNYDDYRSEWYTSQNMGSSAKLGIRQPIKWTDGSVSLINDFSWQDASNKTDGGKNTSFTHNLSLQLNQPLFTYNRTKMQMQELEFSLENAQLSYAMQRLSIEKNVTSQFYGVYQRQKDLNSARDEYNNQKQNYEIIKNKVEAGLVAKEELYQAEVNLATSESSVYSQEISYENAKDNFRQLIGMPLDEEVAVLPNTDIISVEVNPNDAVKYALSQRMEIRQKEISLEQDIFAIIRAKAENEFRGDLNARVGMNALSGKLNDVYAKPTDNEQIGLSLSVPIFDWGAKKARVKSAELSHESNQINFDEEKKGIIIDVRQICRNLPVLIRQINIKKQSVGNAERTYDINQEKYRNGNLTGIELQQYQSQLTNARQTYTNAIISYKLELLNLKIQTLWDFENNTTYLPVDLLKKDY